jgi:hypothetical protein
MKHFVLFVEGYTERRAIAEFLKRWLDPQLHHPVRIAPVRFSGYGELLRDVATRARTTLTAQNADDIIAVISLIDFYGPTFSFPKNTESTSEKCAWAKQEIERQVGHARFRHFFAVHEFEAWLLSMPTLFPSAIRPHLPGNSPETVNSQTPPKALLRQLYRQHMGRHYKEAVNGPDLFSRLDPAKASAKCPALKALLDEMLALARQAGC